MRSASGKTVELPAETTSPEISKGSTGGKAAAPLVAGASVAAGASVGSEIASVSRGASFITAGLQAARISVVTISKDSKWKILVDIIFFS
jgi:hypothetical protein